MNITREQASRCTTHHAACDCREYASEERTRLLREAQERLDYGQATATIGGAGMPCLIHNKECTLMRLEQLGRTEMTCLCGLDTLLAEIREVVKE